MKRRKTMKESDGSNRKERIQTDQIDSKKITKRINFKLDQLKNKATLIGGNFENEQAIREFDWRKNKKIVRFLYFYMPYMKDKEIKQYKSGSAMEQKGLNLDRDFFEEEKIKELFSEDSEEYKDFVFIKNKHKVTNNWTEICAGLLGDLEENIGNRVFMKRMIFKLQE